MDLFSIVDKGGWVAWCLASLSLFLWYFLAYRYFVLKSKVLKVSPRLLNISGCSSKEDVLLPYLMKVNEISQLKIEDKELALEVVRTQLNERIKVHKSVIGSIVVIAPLLGLLGTVIGMIETFSSMQDSALFSQSGGIAGGISQALITTQMGLVVAIPGLLIGKRFDKKETDINAYLEQFIGVINTKTGSKNEVEA